MKPALQALLDRMGEEHELAPGAATASDVAEHYDRVMAQALAAGDPDVLVWAVGRLGDGRAVRRAAPPHDAIEGGYGRSFGTLTLGDKARFLLRRLLPAEAAERAIAEGPAWLDRALPRLRWQAAGQRFTLD